jgi:O-antigen/teichoic acid export membrane protein
VSAFPGERSAIRTPDDAHEHHQRGTRQLLIGRGVFFVSAYVVSAILTRQLGPTDYGTYGVIVSLLLWLEKAVTAEIPTATTKLMADGRHDPAEIERSARALLLGGCVLFMVVGAALAPAVADFMHIQNGSRLLRLAVLDLPFAAIYMSYEGALHGYRRFGALATAQVAFALARVATVVALFAVGFSIGGALVAMVLSSLAICLFLGVRLQLWGFRPGRRAAIDVARLAASMSLCLISTQVLLNLDAWSLKVLWTRGGDVIGYYIAAANVARALSIIPSAQAGVLFASVAWAMAGEDGPLALRHIREASRLALIVSAGACVILGLNAGDTLALLFSRAYAGGAAFLPLQLVAFGLFALLNVCTSALMAVGRQRLVSVVLTVAVPVIGFSNYLLIPAMGPIGAAISLMVGMAFALLAAGIVTWRHFGALMPARTVFRVTVAVILVAISSAAFNLGGAWIVVKLFLLSGLYALLLFVFGEISRDDFRLRRAGA